MNEQQLVEAMFAAWSAPTPNFARLGPYAHAALSEMDAKGHTRYTDATWNAMWRAERELKCEYRWRPFDPPRHQ